MPNENHGTADLFEIIRTTRSMRRLKPDPVPNELIRKVLEAGVCAPSGGNMQRWRFLLIRDPKVKETVGALYKRAWDEQVGPRYRSGEPAPGTSRERFERMLAAGEYLAAHIHEAPVWIVPCLEGGTPARTSGSSIYPAVQNMLLAASARPRRDSDDAVFAVRERGGGRSRVTVRRPFLCFTADRLSNGAVRASPPCPSRRCRLRRSVG
jgi:nitroreductase